MKQRDWIYAYGSVIGSGHLLNNTNCQDHCDVHNFEDYIIAVVSDGAGSYEHSEKGSKLVVSLSATHFHSAVKENKWNESNKLPNKDEWQQVAIKALRRVREDLYNYSINEQLDFKSLSCTIIVVVAFKHGLLVTHIGDGRAGYCNQSLEWKSMIQPFHGELANQTVFVTSDIWYEEVINTYIESNVIEEDVNAFCLLSDGCERASFECNLFDQEKQAYFDPNRPYSLFFNPNVKALKQLFEQKQSQEEINSLWEKFLTAGTGKLKLETDDKTLILAIKADTKINEANAEIS